MAQTSTSKCSLCGLYNAIHFCYECRKALCNLCRTPHDNIFASKIHPVKDLKSVDLTAFQSISNCKAHNGDFSFYCRQCTVMICGKCVTTIHKGHNLSNIDQMANEVRGEAEILVVKMKDKLTKSSMLIEKIEDSHLPEIKLQARCFSKAIKLAIVEIHQFIDSKGDVKLTEVEDFEILETDLLRIDLANRKQVHYRCSSLHSTLEQLIKEQHAFTFLNAYENLKGDFKEFQDMELGSIEVIRPPHFDKKLFTEELIETLVQFKASIETDLSKELKSESDSGPDCTGAPLIQAQPAKKNVLIIAGHSWQSHPKMHRFDDIRFHSDGLTLFDEIEDDSKHIILALLWTHQDYFDQKLLSRAQAEYNFYRLLEKQWRQTLRRINMDDIKYPKFFMNDFRSIPRNRPLYAVICTILDLSKDENGHEAATKAAKEYQKLTVLELNMIQQKLITTVIYDFCQKVSQEQIDRLIEEMIPPVINPVDSGTEVVRPASEQIRTKTEQMAREYRKIVAPTSVKVLQKEIFDNHIKGHKLQEPVSKELVAYVEQCIDLIWYMCIQQPPMEIRWAVKGEKFNKEQFRFSGRKGKKYRMTVWPAVFLHKEGPLVAPGYAVPDK